MNEKKMTVWGSGPVILGSGYGVFIVMYLITMSCPDIFQVVSYVNGFFWYLGLIMIALGVIMWIMSGIQVSIGFKKGILVTHGVYVLSRNPLYSAHIVLIMPGLVLMVMSYLLILGPIVSYIVFKITIKREETFLIDNFGDDYLEYCKRVNQLFPFPKISRT